MVGAGAGADAGAGAGAGSGGGAAAAGADGDVGSGKVGDGGGDSDDDGATGPAGKIVYVDLYSEVCAKTDEAKVIEADVDAIIAGAAGQAEKKLVKLLDAKMKTLHTSDAILLKPEYCLGDQAHLNRKYLHLPVAAIARALE